MSDPEQTGPYQPGGTSGADLPSHIDRYRIERILGKGGYGLVYLGYDDQLQRHVAIKVPHPHRIANPDEAEAYLAEARTVANLDHPNIVPVYHVGSTPDCPCYVVSKFVEGTDLAARLKQSRLSIRETADLIATIAEALHYAHKQGLVHRDIKPGNILLDKSGKAFVVDFGLALQEENIGRGPKYAGTPAYMSPEQARGEGHRVDGRSDVFSLGVVFYELLTGKRPFKGETQDELLDQITTFEARPPRQNDDAIPKEMERICLKALSKRASERYTTAKDMAEDLRHWISALDGGRIPAKAGSQPPESVVEPEFLTAPGLSKHAPAMTRHNPPSSESHPLRIVPKGLRSFDAHDVDFFLELLPGPRDRDGLPDSIRFWKNRIEETDPEKTFTVGLIYGPSGCGKSSLVKAGLLPRVSADVIPLYVEATAEDTEARLLNGLQKRCPTLPANLGMKDILGAIRRGQGIPAGKKVVIVLDQFEQWLHAKKEEENTELVQALRQCDGSRVQCIVMVRDDFWMAATRFMRELEVRLVEDQNSAPIDLFDADHAKKVLAAFGWAFGKLPEDSEFTSKEQKEFLNQSVLGLAQDGKVISVRLALFAEMMKGKPWTLASLKAVGGTAGVGVTFLEETFSASTAPPEHRYHEKAARAGLKALLPETGSDIKGHMRSYAELLKASGYGNRPKDFDDLIRILDNEVRLITPIDTVAKEAEDSVLRTKPREKYYQLTHDYLVHSIREWLTRKQKETRRGRAELLLVDRAVVWNSRPENRQLPSLLQWLQIRRLTSKMNWTPPQRKMMRKASRYHAFRSMVVALFLAMLGLGSREGYGQLQAQALRKNLLNANTNEVPKIVADMASYRRWIDPLLRDAYSQAEKDNDRSKRLHISLALLPVDVSQVDYLYSRLLAAAPNEVPVIRDALAPHKDVLLERLWAAVERPEKGEESQRLRAAAALAKYDPENERWGKAGGLVVDDLVQENHVFLGQWSEAFRPVKNRLLPRLTSIFRDHQPERTAERILAMSFLADYAADQPQVLAGLVMEADEKQFAVIYPKFKDRGEEGRAFLQDEVKKQFPPILAAETAIGSMSSMLLQNLKEELAKRQANAAVALFRMNEPEKLWPLLKHSPDPRVRSYLIHRLSPLGADATTIVKRLDEETDTTIRRALILSLGEFNEARLSAHAQKALLSKLEEIYRTDADPGLHAASEWLLRAWKQEACLTKLNENWAKKKEQREKLLDGIRQSFAKENEKTPPKWYVNTQGQTFVVFPGPVQFVMGSPEFEKDRDLDEIKHIRHIGRSFAIASKSVTFEQYRRRVKDAGGPPGKLEGFSDLPVFWINWYAAARYCNLLSEVEGIEPKNWCYEPDNLGQMVTKSNYLQLKGYRLPTEAEMEYATRAGAETSRFYGETDTLLEKYAWYALNANGLIKSVGLKKPNDFGLFDMHGNCYTWCHEAYAVYPAGLMGKAVDDTELFGENPRSWVIRGGSFLNHSWDVRSANRDSNPRASSGNYNGFRLARTIAP